MNIKFNSQLAYRLFSIILFISLVISYVGEKEVLPVQAASFSVLSVSSGIYDDANSAWTYSGSWSTNSGTGAYANSLHQNSTTGDYAEVAFSGTQIKFTYLKAPGRGNIDVYIDGSKVTTISAYSASIIWQTTWTSSLLSAGEHTVRFQNAGGGWIDIDAIQVYVPVGAGIYDDANSAWTYSGSWSTNSGTGAYANTLHQNSTTGNYAEVAFSGDQVKLTYLKAPSRGYIDVYIDGSKVTTLSAYSASIIWQTTWTSSSFTNGVHVVRFQNAGGGWIDIDALQVFSTAPDTTAPAAINPLAASTGSGNGVVNLNWTAVGDDNNTGTATSYVVRYATNAILSDANWTSATLVSSGLPTPKAAGQAETMTVSGLTAGSTYYFAIRAQDEQGNLGALSNSPSATASTVQPVNAGIYDDANSAWSYSGSWSASSGTGAYTNTLHQNSTTGDYAEVTFNGAQVKLTYLKAPSRGSIDVYIDGSKVTTLNAYSASIVWQTTWTSSLLSAGEHTVRFQNAGGGWIDIDALQVYSPSPDLIIQSITFEPTIPQTDEAVTFTVIVKNQGQADAGAYHVDLFIDHSVPTDCTSGGDVILTPSTGIPAGSSETFIGTYDAGFVTNGSHIVNGVVDTNCQVAESDESNDTKQITVNVPVGAGIYDDANSAWSYSGSWSTNSGTGAYANTLHQNSTTGNYAEVAFSGDQVKLTYLKAPSRGYIDVYIDGSKVTTLSAYSASIIWQTTWTSSSFTNGVHVVRFQNAGGGWIDIDALQVFSTAPDTTAPAAINPLAASTGSGNGTVNLNWTAVGDNNNTGTATSYVVRYATNAILSDANWTSATLVSSGLPTPKAAGQAETMTVSGLTAGSTYYFAIRAQDEQGNLGALSNSPSATAATVTSVSSGTYDDADSAWTYSGTWGVFTGSGPYANTLHQSNTTGNYAEVTFNGAQVKLTYLKAPGRGSIDVYIDGSKVTTLNAYSASIVWQASWTSAGLSSGVHTVRLQNAGGGWIDIDALQVFSFMGAGTYDDTISAWNYSGTWSLFSGTGPYASTLHQSDTAGNYAEVTFNGTQAKLIYLKAPGRGSIDVYIDSNKVATINAYSASIVWQASWTSAGLTNGVHTIRLQNAGGGWIDIDAITIQ